MTCWGGTRVVSSPEICRKPSAILSVDLCYVRLSVASTSSLIRHVDSRVARIWKTTSTLEWGNKLRCLKKRKLLRAVNSLAVHRESSSIPSSSFPPHGCSLMAAVCYFFFLNEGGKLASLQSALSCDYLFFSSLCSLIPKVIILFLAPPPPFFFSYYPSNLGGCVDVTYFLIHTSHATVPRQI